MKSDYVFFWGGCFSNFYPCKFMEDGIEYNCSEQYFMAKKSLFFNDKKAFEKILEAKEPREQKAIGRTIEGFDADKWSSVSRGYMYSGVYAKFAQNPHLQKALLATGDKNLCESSPHDSVWGIGLHETDPLAWDKETWKGTNWLGETLDMVRRDIRINLLIED